MPIATLIISPPSADGGDVEEVSSAAYVPHAPIFIDGNSGFNNASGVTWGNGTQQDPFVIENIEIDASGCANAISITNSSAHFKISGCRLVNAKADGIFLCSVTNGSLESNKCSLNAYYGIALVGSSNNTISNNSCSGGLYGINLHGSDMNRISNNSCSGNTYYGIALVTSAENKISNNSCHFNQCGIDLQQSDENTISGNNCSGGQYGVCLFGSDSNLIANNTCSLDQYGIQMRSSNNNTLSGNACLSSAIAGISADSSGNNSVSDNLLLGNSYGLEFKRSRIVFTYNSDFLFYRIDNTYYAKNNDTNETQSDTDARALIQRVIDSLDSRPARFFFDSSEYVINSSGQHENQYSPKVIWEIGLRVNKQISFICNGTTFKADSNLPNPFLVFYIENVDFVEIRGAHIDCNQVVQDFDKWVTGVMTYNANYILVEYCDITNFGGYGIFIDLFSSYPTIRYNYVHDNVDNDDYAHGIALHNNGFEGLVIGNRVDRIAKYAIFIDSVSKVRVIGNSVGEGGGWGIMVSDKCNATVVVGNTVTRRNPSFGSIGIMNSYCTQVIDNHIFGNWTSNPTYGYIYVNAASSTSVIRNNHLDNAIIENDGNSTSIFENDGSSIEEQPYAFTVYRGGANYFADNATGVLTHTNSNFTALMSSVFSDASANSSILFKKGNYTVEVGGAVSVNGSLYGIMINKSLRLEGLGAMFAMASGIGRNYTMAYAEGPVNLKIEDIAFDVNSNGQGTNFSQLTTCGITVNGSIRPTIQKCEFYDFTSCAVDMNGTPEVPTMKEYNIIEERTFSRNTIYGILLSYSCNSNRVYGNNFSGSTSYGIKISSNSSGNVIWNNTLLHNNLTADTYDPSKSQAFDGCAGNRWNSSGAPHGYGNYWSDWKDRDFNADGIQDSPYNLTGITNQTDFYPLATPLPTPTTDLIPSFTVPTPIGNMGANGWYVSSVLFPWLASNSQVDYGLYYMFYKLDSGASGDYNGPISIGGSGIHTIGFWILDAAGNLEEVATNSFNIDIMAPLIEVTANGTLGTNGWFRSIVNLTMLVTDDGSGLNATRYRIDEGLWINEIWQNGTVNFTLSDGIHDIQYYSIDNASNQGLTKTLKIKVDTVLPEVGITSPSDVVTTGTVEVDWYGIDHQSGIARYEVVVDGGDVANFDNLTNSMLLELSEGDHNVTVKAIDVAGNSAESKIEFTIDLNVEPPGGGMGNYLSIVIVLGIAAGGFILLYLLSLRQKRLRGPKDE